MNQPFTIQKTAITARPRKLKGKWTIEDTWRMEDRLQFRIRETQHREWCIDLHDFWGSRQVVIEWCKEQFGAHGNNRRYRWRINYSSPYPDRIFLRREEDVTLFSLRWA